MRASVMSSYDWTNPRKSPEVFRIHRARSYHFVIAVWRIKDTQSAVVKHWEIIGDNLKKHG
jgi:hypothetical protein